MNAIIGIKAASDRGKTSAIVRVAEILKTIPGIIYQDLLDNPRECRCIIIWEDCKIGLFSEGDASSAVKRNLDIAKDCNIVVLALHGGKSESYIRNISAKSNTRYFVSMPCYKNIWLANNSNAEIDNDSDKQIVVNANAAQIISLITQLKQFKG